MSVSKPSLYADQLPALRKSIHDHWRVFLAEGIVLIALGFGAIFVPPVAGLVTTLVLGWVLLLAGGAGLAAAFVALRAPGFGWALLSPWPRSARAACCFGAPCKA
jgi:uncharacterized membrane protein HdeD (DUF308 family)